MFDDLEQDEFDPLTYDLAEFLVHALRDAGADGSRPYVSPDNGLDAVELDGEFDLLQAAQWAIDELGLRQ